MPAAKAFKRLVGTDNESLSVPVALAERQRRGSGPRDQGHGEAVGRQQAELDTGDHLVATVEEGLLLEQGTVPWRRPWKSGESLPKNLKSGKAYRGVNVFLLSCAPFASPYWVTFKQAKALGGSVKKGVKGYPVIFWNWVEKEERSGDPDSKTRLPLLRYYCMFSVEQCEGLDIPSTEGKASSFTPIAAAERIVAGMPEAPRIEHNDGRAYYRPSEDLVSVPRPTLFADVAEYYCTILHELGHATGAEKRLARPGITDEIMFGSHEYSKEELVAEMTAAFLCGYAGLDNSTLPNSAAYIGSWLKKLRDDRRLVVSAAAQAQRAADLILGTRFDLANAVED